MCPQAHCPVHKNNLAKSKKYCTITGMLQVITILVSWIFPLIILAIFGFSCFLYAKYESNLFLQKKSKKFWYVCVIAAIAVLYIAYAGISTYAQYYLWEQDGVGQTLLNTPLKVEATSTSIFSKAINAIAQTKFGYFIFYSWGRFWFWPSISACFGLLWFGFLTVLKKYNDRYFYEGETMLGLVLALLVGWPKVLIFIPLTFFMVVFVSIYRGIRYKEIYTSLGVPFLWAAAIAILCGGYLVSHTALSVFAITSSSGISLF
jgi:hypothetical protein